MSVGFIPARMKASSWMRLVGVRWLQCCPIVFPSVIKEKGRPAGRPFCVSVFLVLFRSSSVSSSVIMSASLHSSALQIFSSVGSFAPLMSRAPRSYCWSTCTLIPARSAS